MRKVEKHFKVTHVMASGKVLTDEEFMSKPYVVDYEKNKEWYAEIAKTYDPFYSKKEMKKIEIEMTARRKAELEAEMKKIQEQLADL